MRPLQFFLPLCETADDGHVTSGLVLRWRDVTVAGGGASKVAVTPPYPMLRQCSRETRWRLARWGLV